MTGYAGRFMPKWWCYYLVNVTDWSNPHIIKRHFQNEELANRYMEKYITGMNFEIVKGSMAMDMDIRIYRTKSNGTTRPFYPIKSKYEFPDWAKTSKDKQKARLRMRKKLKVGKRLPELTHKDIYAFLKNRPTSFARLCSRYKRWHYPFLENSFNLSIYKKSYPWPSQLREICIIEKTLRKYNYDFGLWPVTTMVSKVYDYYGDRIHKFINHLPTKQLLIDKEFKARGFVLAEEFKHNPDTDNYVCSIDGKWIYPQLAWLSMDDKKKVGGYNIYTLQGLVGISGYTRAWIKRKLVNTI